MSRLTVAAELRGYRPGNTGSTAEAADYVIPGSDIRSVDISERVGDLKDDAEIMVENRGAKYTGAVDHGDRIEFLARIVDGAGGGYGDGPYGGGEYGDPSYSDRGFGEGPFGTGPFGAAIQRLWTGKVGPYTIDGEGADRYSLKVTGPDFVFGWLAERQAYEIYRGQQISDILRDLVETYVPEVDPSGIDPISQTTDLTVSGQSVFKIARSLAARGDAILSSSGATLEMTPAPNLDASFNVTPDDFTTLSAKSNDDGLVNEWRVDGGTGVDVDASQTTVSGYQTVTNSNRIIQQFSHPKAQVAEIELWTRITGSGDGVRVRLQKDDNGAPEDIGNSQKDLARRTLAEEFLEEPEGWTSFIMPDNTVPGTNPWFIVETDNAGTGAGQDIGVNGSGVPAFKSHYPYPVNVSLPDGESQEKYGLRQGHVTDDSLNTFAAAEDTARAKLQKSAEPTHTVTTAADSGRMHDLTAGEVVAFDEPNVEAVGYYVVTERSHSYEHVDLTTDLGFRKLPEAIASEVTPA